MSHQLNNPMGHNQSKLTVKVKIVNLRAGGIPLPQYATPGSAAVDLLAVSIEEKYLLQPGDSVMIGTGYAVHIGNPGIAGFVLPRSGMGAKRGLVLGNLIGLIDSDYQGEIMVSLWNRGKVAQVIQPMERIAQLTFMPVYQAELLVVESFDQATERGEGGFGSTGSAAPIPGLKDMLSISTDPNLLDRLYDLGRMSRDLPDGVSPFAGDFADKPLSWPPISSDQLDKAVPGMLDKPKRF